ARVDTCDRRSSHGPVGRGRSGWSGIRSEDTDLPRSASPAGLTHPARSAGTHTRASTAPPTVRRTRGGETGRALRRRRPAAGARVRLPFFSGDLLEHVDLEVAVGHHFLEPAVFPFELPEPPHVGGLQRAEPLPPGVDRL